MSDLVRYRTNDGVFSALIVKRGRKLITLIPLTAFGDTGLKVLRLALSEERRMTPILYKGKHYPINRALRTFRRAARTFGATTEVKRSLKNYTGE